MTSHQLIQLQNELSAVTEERDMLESKLVSLSKNGSIAVNNKRGSIKKFRPSEIDISNRLATLSSASLKAEELKRSLLECKALLEKAHNLYLANKDRKRTTKTGIDASPTAIGLTATAANAAIAATANTPPTDLSKKASEYLMQRMKALNVANLPNQQQSISSSTAINDKQFEFSGDQMANFVEISRFLADHGLWENSKSFSADSTVQHSLSSGGVDKIFSEISDLKKEIQSWSNFPIEESVIVSRKVSTSKAADSTKPINNTAAAIIVEDVKMMEKPSSPTTQKPQISYESIIPETVSLKSNVLPLKKEIDSNGKSIPEKVSGQDRNAGSDIVKNLVRSFEVNNSNPDVVSKAPENITKIVAPPTIFPTIAENIPQNSVIRNVSPRSKESSPKNPFAAEELISGLDNPFDENNNNEASRFQEFLVYHEFSDGKGFSIGKGDTVSVDLEQSESDPLRWYGFKLGNYEFGWFPRSCVEEDMEKNVLSLENPFDSVNVLNAQEPEDPFDVNQESLKFELKFETSWVANVSPDIFNSMSKDQVKRQESIFELIATERRYVRSLQILVQIFIPALQKVMDQISLKVIFCNVEELLLFNTLLLREFEDRQAREMPVVSRIGDILSKHLKSMHMYLTYCGNQYNASKALIDARKANKRVSDVLKECMMDARCRQLDISSFLLEPMQRITRYPLLIKQILHYTPKTSNDSELLVESLGLAENLLKRANEAAKEQDSDDRLKQLQDQIDFSGEHINLAGFTKLVGKRKIIREGSLLKGKSNRKLHVILMNDLLFLLEKASNVSSSEYTLYRKPIPLDELIVREVENPKMFSNYDSSWFQFVHIDNIITVKGESVQDKRAWINEIEEAIKNIRVSEKRQSKGFKGPSDASCIGTLEVYIKGAKNLMPVISGGKISPFCIIQINEQRHKTKVLKDTVNPLWDQSLMFSLASLDDILRITVYHYDRYGTNAYLGQSELALDFLEYYGKKETETINVKLKDVPSGTVSVQLHYRSAA